MERANLETSWPLGLVKSMMNKAVFFTKDKRENDNGPWDPGAPLGAGDEVRERKRESEGNNDSLLLSTR